MATDGQQGRAPQGGTQTVHAATLRPVDQDVANRPPRPRWPNPLRGLDRPGEIWAWGFYDLANQSFTLLINTLLFPIFFREVVVGSAARGEALWGLAAGGAYLIVALLSPLLGAMADYRAVKKRMLVTMCVVCVLATCALAALPPGAVWLAVALYVVAAVAYSIGDNFVGAFLPELATPTTMGRVSAFGWGIAYVGALILLVLTTASMAVLAWDTPDRWRPLFIAAGLWYLVMAIPTFVVLRERAVPRPIPAGRTLLSIGFGRTMETLGHARRHRHLFRFLCVMFVYSMGVNAMIFFSALMAKDFGFGGAALAGFLIPITICGILAAVVVGRIQDRIGGRTTVHVFLSVWVLTAGAIIGLRLMVNAGHAAQAEWLFWVVGCLVGASMGGLGTAGRAMVGVFTPVQRTAEFFGLWGVAVRLSGVLGIAGFGLLRAWSELGSVVALMSVFILAGGLLFLVDERAGRAEAVASSNGQA
jgi:UMF1 family MFS transporter